MATEGGKIVATGKIDLANIPRENGTGPPQRNACSGK